MSRATESTSKPQRTRRASVNGVRNVLTVSGKESGYQYRIVNDSGDRVAQMQEVGYEIVQDDAVRVGDRRIANPTKEGSPVKVSVGNGQQAYVMRIKQEWYDEDQASKAERADELERGTLREAKQNADYGQVKVNDR